MPEHTARGLAASAYALAKLGHLDEDKMQRIDAAIEKLMLSGDNAVNFCSIAKLCYAAKACSCLQ